jgi:uncharacterized lipoprotein YajG
MKNLDLNSMGVQELNAFEMQETDGGIIWFVVIAAAALLLTSCQTQVNIQVGGANNSLNKPVQVSDSTLNGNNVSVPLQ